MQQRDEALSVSWGGAGRWQQLILLETFFFFFAVLQLHGWPIKNVIISPKDLRLDRRNTWPNNNAHGNLEEVAERNTFREYKKI